MAKVVDKNYADPSTTASAKPTITTHYALRRESRAPKIAWLELNNRELSIVKSSLTRSTCTSSSKPQGPCHRSAEFRGSALEVRGRFREHLPRRLESFLQRHGPEPVNGSIDTVCPSIYLPLPRLGTPNDNGVQST